jgi:hypothetical protein
MIKSHPNMRGVPPVGCMTRLERSEGVDGVASIQNAQLSPLAHHSLE